MFKCLNGNNKAFWGGKLEGVVENLKLSSLES